MSSGARHEPGGGEGADRTTGQGSAAWGPDRLVEAVDDAPAGLVAVDEVGDVRYANEAAQQLLGRTELIGKPFGLPLSRRRAAMIELRDAAGQMHEAEMEVTRVRVDGRWLWLATLREVERFPAGIEALLAQLDASEDVLALTSAELREPLRGMVASTEQLAGRWEQLPPIRRMALLRRILGETQRMGDTIARILDAAALEAGHVVPVRDPVVVLDVVLAGLPEIRDAVDDIDISIGPDASADVSAEHLWTMISSLVVNAGKFAAGTVEVAADVEEDGWCRIEVSDRGDGIAPEHRELVFERYRRLPGTEELPGLGIGLWVVRELARAYGGEAWTEPVETTGRGARFVVKVPSSPSGIV